MPAFFVEPAQVRGDVLCLEGEEAHHVRVRRYRPGDEVDVIDGTGGGYRARLDTIETDRVTAAIVRREPERAESRVRLQLLAAVVKGARFDVVVEKATEVGVAAIRPVVAERSVARGGRADRWRRLARSAAKQCGRSRVPDVADPAPLAQVAAQVAVTGARLLVADPSAPQDLRAHLGGTATSLALVVGPEGGFEPAEQQALASAGGLGFSWGPRILRAETAAVVLSALVLAVAEWQLRDGDLDGRA